MNYKNIYDDLIKRGIKRTEHIGYFESHHIIHRCMGGTDEIFNIVRLTPEEHYVAHQLLVKIYPSNHKLVRAAFMMCRGRKNNKFYGWLKRRFSKVQSERMKSDGPTYNKRWISNGIETVLVDKDIASKFIQTKTHIHGKNAIIAECGHIVKERCVPCENAKRKSYDLKKENAKILASTLFNQFKKSGCKSVTEFAIMSNTTQPRLSALWKKYVPEYNEKRHHGKRFLN